MPRARACRSRLQPRDSTCSQDASDGGINICLQSFNLLKSCILRRNLIIESDSPTWKSITNGASTVENEGEFPLLFCMTDILIHTALAVILSAAPSGRDSLPNAASPVNTATASSVSKSRPQKGGVQVGGSHSIEGIPMEESNVASNGSRNAPKRLMQK